nr:aminopeptidase P family N-terminal domain-containing protein [Chloroflexota bacterium]
MRAKPSAASRRPNSDKKSLVAESQTPVTGWRIEQPEYDARVERVRAELDRRELDGLVLFQPIRMAYLTGF